MFGNRGGYTSESPGFSILQRSANELEFSIANGVKQVSERINFPDENIEIYVAMTVDTVAGVATAYCGAPHYVYIKVLDLAGMDLTKITGKYSTIGFNENARGDYLSSGMGMPGKMQFKNVGIWNRVLAEQEVRYICTAPRLLPDLLPSTEGVSARKPVQYYTTVDGDTLRKIAREFYGNPDRWGVIYEANIEYFMEHMEVYAGSVFRIPEI